MWNMMKNSYSGIKVDGCCKAFALSGRMAACCIPRALPWARSFCPFRACGDNLLSIIQGVWSQLAKHYSGRVGSSFGIPDTTKRVYMLCFIIIVHKDNLSER